MTTTPTAMPNGRHPAPQPTTVSLRKLTDPPTTVLAPGHTGSVPGRDIAWSLATGKPIPHDWLPHALALTGQVQMRGVSGWSPRDPG